MTKKLPTLAPFSHSFPKLMHLGLISILLTVTALACGGKSVSEPRPGDGADDDSPERLVPPHGAECIGAKDCESDDAVCVFGRCVNEPKECSASKVACDEAVPSCPDGEVPSVEETSVKGNCWGACVPIESCSYMPSCEACVSLDRLCLSAGEIPEYACATIDTDCRACSCLPEDICGPLDCWKVENDVVSCAAGS